MDDSLLTTEQVAEYLGVDPATVRRYRERGMPAIVLPGGQTIRYFKSEVEQWLDSLRRPQTITDLEPVR
jgi:excisionase family DNA binding protein